MHSSSFYGTKSHFEGRSTRSARRYHFTSAPPPFTRSASIREKGHETRNPNPDQQDRLSAYFGDPHCAFAYVTPPDPDPRHEQSMPICTWFWKHGIPPRRVGLYLGCYGGPGGGGCFL